MGERRQAERRTAPAYQWYPKDYELDEAVKLMSYEQEGIYRRLLDHQWLNGSLPADPKQIAKLVPKVPAARFLKLWEGIAEKFNGTVPGRLTNGRLERQRQAAEAYRDGQSDAGKLGAAKRWGGK